MKKKQNKVEQYFIFFRLYENIKGKNKLIKLKNENLFLYITIINYYIHFIYFKVKSY
jgi:hypothetical protein